MRTFLGKPPIYTFHFAIALLVLAVLNCAALIFGLVLQNMALSICSGIFVLVAAALAILCLFAFLKRRKSRLIGQYGELKMRFELCGKLIEVYNYTMSLSSVNCTTLVIDSVAVDQYCGIKNCTLRGAVADDEGESEVVLRINNFIGILRLYCKDKLLAKKLMLIG